MDKIIELLKTIVNGKLAPIVSKIVDFLLGVSKFAEKIYDNKRTDEAKQEEKNVDAEIKNACDSGTLDDLLDATEKKGKL